MEVRGWREGENGRLAGGLEVGGRGGWQHNWRRLAEQLENWRLAGQLENWRLAGGLKVDRELEVGDCQKGGCEKTCLPRLLIGSVRLCQRI